MKSWPFVIAVLYGLIILVLTLPVTVISFYQIEDTIAKDFKEVTDYYLTWWPYWVWLAVMIAAQAALLIIPVRVKNERPVTKKAIILPIVAAVFMTGLLVAGAALSIMETVTQEPLEGMMWWTALAIMLLSWFLWGSIFRRWSKGIEPKTFIDKQCRCLFRGSILELLVAVPTHVLARCRDYCCAGFATFVGIAFGLSVMLFSFGPGVYYLFAKRWKEIRPKG